MSDNPSSPGRKSDTLPLPPDEPRLESWGEIASYLRRDIRTVQRWEKEQGLPVRRLVIGKMGQVYAFRSELDRWMLERQPRPEPDLPGHPPEVPLRDATLVEPPVSRQTRKRFSRSMVLAVLGGLLFSLAIVYVLWPPRTPPPRFPATSRLLLFVRPLTDLSPNPGEKEFADGLTDEMITQLGRVAPKSLGVFAPTTSKELATRTIRELKRDLNADFVLEGSVRRESEQIRIDIDLISTADQTHTWTNSYTGSLRKFLTFQDQVTTDVVKHLILALPSLNSTDGASSASNSSLTHALDNSLLERSHTAPTATVDPDVSTAYLSGRVYLLDRDFARSVTAFQHALDKDPRYAPALAGLAMSVLLLGESPNDALPPLEALPKARQSAYQALKLDPNLSDAYCVLANFSQAYDHNLAESERLYQKAIELDPSNVTALKWYADHLFVTNRLAEASREIDKALEIDPASPLLNTARAEIKYYQRDFDGTIEQAQRTTVRYPEFILARFWLASAYRQKKMFPQALEQFDELRKHYPSNSAMLMAYGHTLALSGDRAGALKVLSQLQSESRSRYIPSTYIAGMYTGLGDVQQAFYWLDKAYAEKNDRLVYLGVDPIADPLRSDPRFAALMKKVGLP